MPCTPAFARLGLDQPAYPARAAALRLAFYVVAWAASLGVGVALGTMYQHGLILSGLAVLVVAVYAGAHAWRSVRDLD